MNGGMLCKTGIPLAHVMASSLGALADVERAAPSQIDAELHYLVALTYLESAHKLWK